MEEILKVGKAIGFVYPIWSQNLIMTITVIEVILNWMEKSRIIQKFRKKIKAQNSSISKSRFYIWTTVVFGTTILYCSLFAPFLVDQIYEQMDTYYYKTNSPYRTHSHLFLSAFFIPLFIQYGLLFYYRKWNAIINTFIIFLLIIVNASCYFYTKELFIWFYDGHYYWDGLYKILNRLIYILPAMITTMPMFLFRFAINFENEQKKKKGKRKKGYKCGSKNTKTGIPCRKSVTNEGDRCSIYEHRKEND